MCRAGPPSVYAMATEFHGTIEWRLVAVVLERWKVQLGGLQMSVFGREEIQRAILVL